MSTTSALHPQLDEEQRTIITSGPGTIAGVSVRVTRKFQIGKDNWYGLDALVTLAVSEAEAALTDPEELTDRAFRIARAGVARQRVEAEREAAEEAAQRRAAAQVRRNGADEPPPPTEPPGEDAEATPQQPATVGTRYIVSSTPATADEAEHRFFARYGAIVGGQTWASVQRYMNLRSPKPTSVEGWIAAAEAVRDQSRAAASAPTTQAAPDVSQDRTNGRRPPHINGAAPSGQRRRDPEF